MKRLFVMIACLLATSWLYGQSKANYDEEKVPQYSLPDVLLCNNGTRVTTARQWEKQRRPEVLDMFSGMEYGRTPTEKIKKTCQLLHEDTQALSGIATSQQVLVTFSGMGKTVKALLLAYIPNHRKGKVPVFITYNFKGNHSVTDDECILYSPYFDRYKDSNVPELQRNTQASRWPLKMIVSRGYAIVTMCYQDIFPDNADGGIESVKQLFPDSSDETASWQAIGVWAWGSSRIADWAEKQPWADCNQFVIMGHSRQGKAAVWAGAQDKRFKVVISNDSGCGGAALYKREFGERIEPITQNFPHWFCASFAQYSGKEQQLPFDQHELLALIAPRYLYVASAEEDLWADPYGEYLAAYHASSVYALYGLAGISSPSMPAVHQPIMNHVGYHIRSGKHDVTEYDWEQYLGFCDKAFGRMGH